MGPCEIFTTPEGEIELGPYGSRTDYNLGYGFENPPGLVDALTGPGGSSVVCGIVDLLGPGLSLGLPLLNTGSMNLSLYTTHMPAYAVEGEHYPVIVWGNGPCIPPEGYGALLRYIASQGYIVVIPNARTPSAADLSRAIDMMFDADSNSLSPYYKHVDKSRVGVMGHFLGADAAVAAIERDLRIETAVLFNGTDFPDEVPYLAISADDDFNDSSVSDFQDAIDDADDAAFIFYHMVEERGRSAGGFLLMSEPERVVEPAWRWLEYYFFEDQASGDFFVGSDCGLCDRGREFSYGVHGVP